MFRQRLAALVLGIATAIGMGALAQQPPLKNFGTPATGNVTGVASSVDSEIALFSGTGGKTLKRATGTGLALATSGVYSVLAPTDDNLTVGNGTTWQLKALGDCDDSGGNHLNYDTSTNAFSCGTSSSGGGGGTPGGASTNVQYNDAGAFGGESDFAWNATTNVLTLGVTATPTTVIGGAGSGANGAAITMQGGLAGATNTGGLAKLQGGTGGATSGAGGNAQVLGGSSTDGNGGAALLTGGPASGTNRNGGNASSGGGSGIGTGAGGDALITAGPGGATGNGGLARLRAGAATTGTPGDATIEAGTVSTSGPGGSINLTATGGAGTNQNGGNIILTAGNPTGSGTQGALQLVNMTATGAQTATFTATNKPGAATGAPTLWLRVVVSGTTYWVPLFAN